MFNAPLHAAIDQARIERNRTARIEAIVGNALFTILGGCVLFTVTFWLIK
jgi:hypothetical protein